jgi:bifunctional DNase/RNase
MKVIKHISGKAKFSRSTSTGYSPCICLQGAHYISTKALVHHTFKFDIQNRRRRLPLTAAHPSSSDDDNNNNPLPFVETDYYRASLQLVQGNFNSPSAIPYGHLLLMREAKDGLIEDQERALLLSIGGDVLQAIALLMQTPEASAPRPMSLDLLWSVLERGQQISKRDWKLLRIAIVDLRNNTFYGRLFFGDPTTGVAVWDCDCRPSDAIWLSLKSKCRIYINRSVWDTNATPLRELAQQQGDGDEGGTAAAGGGRSSSSSSQQYEEDPFTTNPAEFSINSNNSSTLPGSDIPLDPMDPMAVMISIKPHDAEILKRLKMEMRVALKDEDFAAAARLRDHPFMKQHVKAVISELKGEVEEASEAWSRLDRAVRKYEENGVVEMEEES